MFKPRQLTIASMILFAAISRLIPHPWNFSPVAAMALFGGATFTDKRLAFLVPLGAVFLSDIFIGFYREIPFIYMSYAVIVGIGMLLKKRKSPSLVTAAALASSLSFFLITNFVTWVFVDIYPRTFAGLMACFTAGIPYFRSTIISDLFFSFILFGTFYLAEKRFLILKESSQPI